MSPTKAVTTTAEERKRAGLAARELQAQADRALLARIMPVVGRNIAQRRDPFDSPPPDRNAQSPTTPAPYVAAVRPFHAVSVDDRHPVARVRLTNGLTYLSWHHVRHDDLAAVTHRPATYWLHIDRHAHDVVARIRTLSATGALPQIACFTELRHHIDPNAGWTAGIAALPPEDWTAVQHRVTDILRSI